MKNTKIFGIYGESNSGKTNLITKIIEILREKGKIITTIKISDHKMNFDKKGKDTYLHRKAGAELVVFSSDFETNFLFNNKIKLDSILKLIKKFDNYDYILIEGARDKKIPKIKIGEIPDRENTIIKYDGDIEKIIELMEKWGENKKK